jgi:hypothetical protein
MRVGSARASSHFVSHTVKKTPSGRHDSCLCTQSTIRDEKTMAWCASLHKQLSCMGVWKTICFENSDGDCVAPSDLDAESATSARGKCRTSTKLRSTAIGKPPRLVSMMSIVVVTMLVVTCCIATVSAVRVPFLRLVLIPAPSVLVGQWAELRVFRGCCGLVSPFGSL